MIDKTSSQHILRRLARSYRLAYRRLCGTHPNLHRWHPQWLGGQMLYRDLREWLGNVEGRILDVGCAEKPYGAWATRAREVFGIDIYPGPRVDALIVPDARWPLEDASFDAVLCTQVLQHDKSVTHTLAEIHRVLKPGGLLIITMPFMSNELHMHDYWRLTATGLLHLLGDRYEVISLRKRGAVASIVALLLANWTEVSLGANRAAATVSVLTLPLRLVLYAAINSLATALDRLDRTGAFYANVSLLARKAVES